MRYPLIIFFLLISTVLDAFSQEILIIKKGIDHYELKPYLKKWKGENPKSADTPPHVLDLDGSYEDIGYNPSKKGRYWYQFSIDHRSESDQLYLVLLGSNYASDLKLFTSESSDALYCGHQQALLDRYVERGFLVIPFPKAVGVKEYAVMLEAFLWLSEELIVVTERGLQSHIAKWNGLVLVYLTVFLLLFVGSLAIGLIYKSPLASAYSYYVVITSLALLLELDKLTEWIGYEGGTVIPNIAPIIYSNFCLAMSIYSYLLFREVTMPRWLSIGFKAVIGISVIFIIATIFPDFFEPILIPLVNILQYGGLILLFTATYINRKSKKPIFWFVLGVSLVLFGVVVNDVHLKNWIFWPNSFYIFLISVLVEVILIAVGTFLMVRNRERQLSEARTKNQLLNTNIEKLKSDVNHSMNAYETLAHHRSQNLISVPESYYDNPLSARELQVLLMLSEGLTNQQISDQLNVSRNTIKTHLKHIYAKLGTNKREEAVLKGKDYGLI